jgi:integrase
MTRQHAGSLAYQIEQALKAVFRPGTSRHTAKQIGVAGEVIVSVGTMRAYLGTNNPFANWCHQNYGVKDLTGITPEMATAYIHHLASNGYSRGYINKVQCGLRHLDNGLRTLGRKTAETPALMPVASGRHSDPRNTPLTSAEADRVIADLRAQRDPTYADLAQLQRAAGLRLAEAVNLRARAISADGAKVTLDTNDPKGGKHRAIDIEPAHREFLVRLRAQGLARWDGHVFDGRGGLGRNHERQFAAACRRQDVDHSRTHDMRSTYANETLQALRARWPEETARRLVSQRLGHNRLEVLKHYLADENAGDFQGGNDAQS